MGRLRLAAPWSAPVPAPVCARRHRGCGNRHGSVQWFPYGKTERLPDLRTARCSGLKWGLKRLPGLGQASMECGGGLVVRGLARSGHIIKEKADWYVQRGSQIIKAGCPDTIGSAFILLYLLKRNAEGLPKFFLRHSQKRASEPNTAPDMHVNQTRPRGRGLWGREGGGCFCHAVSHQRKESVL